MQAVVASRFNTDEKFWCRPYDPEEDEKEFDLELELELDLEEEKKKPRILRPSVFHWYRICSSFLTRITFGKWFCDNCEALNRVLRI